MFFDTFCVTQYGDIVVYMYSEDINALAPNLMDKRKNKTLSVLLEYCYLVDVHVMLSDTKLKPGGKKSSALTRAINLVKKYDIAMTEEEIALFQQEVSTI